VPEISSGRGIFHKVRTYSPLFQSGVSAFFRRLAAAGDLQPQAAGSGAGTGSSCSGILCRRSAARAATGRGTGCSGIHQLMICIRIREQLQRQPGQQDPEPGAGDLQRVPFPAATGAELGHQGGRMDKQTDKQPQAAGTGQIWPNQGSGSGILCRDPEQLQQQPGTGSSCSNYQLTINQLFTNHQPNGTGSSCSGCHFLQPQARN